jgi:hypothetical protein
MMRLWIQALAAAVLISAADAQPPQRLWVLQAPDTIVEYDAATFAVRNTEKVPLRLLEAPEYLHINGKGQMLYFPPQGVMWGGTEMAKTGHLAWFRDGKQIKEWRPEGLQTRDRSADQPMLTEANSRCFLSAGGEHLYWFENRSEKMKDESGLERSVRTSARVWRTDLAGGKPETIASLPLSEWCPCGTSVCEETCPEWEFWTPDGVVGDFFLVTRFTPGQLESTYHESLLYQSLGGKWQGRKLSQPVEMPLAAADKGEVLIAAVPDGGCCGWDNESSNQLLLQNGHVSVLYDEFARYGNSDYDVSFFTADARLAPGAGMLAYTVISTVQAGGGDIRLSSTGKENAAALARVRKAISKLPAVEILRLGSKPKAEGVIRRASLAGWLSVREILVAQEGRLAVYDTDGRKKKETEIRVRSGADAFLR